MNSKQRRTEQRKYPYRIYREGSLSIEIIAWCQHNFNDRVKFDELSRWPWGYNLCFKNESDVNWYVLRWS